jgi:hypothetical protein
VRCGRSSRSLGFTPTVGVGRSGRPSPMSGRLFFGSRLLVLGGPVGLGRRPGIRPGGRFRCISSLRCRLGWGPPRLSPLPGRRLSGSGWRRCPSGPR